VRPDFDDGDLDGAARQRELLLFILDVWSHRRRVPTFEEIAGAQRTNKSGVHRAIRILIEKEYLRCDRTRTGRVQAGSVEPTDKAFRWRGRIRERDEPPRSPAGRPKSRCPAGQRRGHSLNRSRRMATSAADRP
jgi:SOS-response transcriptional repressor LexA